MPTSISINQSESREQGQTSDYCSLYSLIPCSFFDSVYICPRLLSLGLVFPRAPSKLYLRQLVQLGLGTRIHLQSFLFLTKGRVQSVNRIKERTMKKSPEQKTVKESSVSALQCKGIRGSLNFIPLFIQKFCLRSSNLLILLTKELMNQMDQLNSHISSVLKEFKLK